MKRTLVSVAVIVAAGLAAFWLLRPGPSVPPAPSSGKGKMAVEEGSKHPSQPLRPARQPAAEKGKASSGPRTSEIVESPTDRRNARFPDWNLEMVVRQMIAGRGDVTRTIRDADLLGLTSFDLVANKGISNLTGMAAMRNLSSLTLNYNKVTDTAPLSGLAGLTYLSLSGNALTNVALDGLPKLRELYLAADGLTDIGFLSGAPALRKVYLAQNNIADLAPLAGLKNVQILDLQHNKVEDISPLLVNAEQGGLGRGAAVWLDDNPLTPEARNVQIPKLQSCHVTVTWTKPAPDARSGGG